MICWPALFKLEGDDELIYFASEQECVCETKELIIGSEDHLVDSKGHVFTVQFDQANHVYFLRQNKRYTLDEVTQLIQKHEFNAAQVCITKIVFSTIEQAVRALG